MISAASAPRAARRRTSSSRGDSGFSGESQADSASCGSTTRRPVATDLTARAS